MEFRMLRNRHRGQVLRPVIGAVAVDVVDSVAFRDGAMNLLPNNLMRKTLSPIDTHHLVTRFCHVTFGLVLTVVRAPFELIRAGSAAKPFSRVAAIYAGMLGTLAGDSLSAKCRPVKSNLFSVVFRVSLSPCLGLLSAPLFIPMVVPEGVLDTTGRLFFRRKQVAVGQVAGSAADTLTSLAAIRTWPPVVALSRYQTAITGGILGLLGFLFHPLEYTTLHGQLSLMAWNRVRYCLHRGVELPPHAGPVLAICSTCLRASSQSASVQAIGSEQFSAMARNMLKYASQPSPMRSQRSFTRLPVAASAASHSASDHWLSTAGGRGAG
jgi:hypothetical protein